jgi:hypothetical protein
LYPALAFYRQFKDEASPKDDSVFMRSFDNAMLMHCSSMMAGALHNNDQLPVVFPGGAGGSLQGGRALDCSGGSERQLCRLFLSMMDKLNVRLNTIGDAACRLEEV